MLPSQVITGQSDSGIGVDFYTKRRKSASLRDSCKRVHDLACLNMVVAQAPKSAAKVDDSQDQIAIDGDSTVASVQDRDSATEAGATSINGQDLPRSNSGDSGTVVTVLLTEGKFEFVLTDSRKDSPASVANTDYHALFVKDKEACSCLEQYDKATSALRLNETSQSGSTSTGVPALSPPLTDWLRKKDEHTRVLLTPKKHIPTDTWSSARRA